MSKKRLAVVITTYNRKEKVDECIKSLLDSDYDAFDIYVVDNACTDGTKKYLDKKYGRKIKTLKVKINLGGCNGFNEGVKKALKKNYEYITLCDDDIIVEKDTLSNMVDFIDRHDEVGVVGPRTYKRGYGYKDTLQEYGTYLGWGTIFNITVDNYSKIWSDECKPWIYVDYIPACLMLVRSSIIKKVGGIEIDYGGYFEDIDLGYKAILLGYKIAVDSRAIIYHCKLSTTGHWKETTVKDYYMNRSKLLFYIRYSQKRDIPKVCKLYLIKLYELLMSAKYKGDKNTYDITLLGFLHGFSGVLNSAGVTGVVLRKKKNITLSDKCKDSKNIYIDKYIDEYFISDVMNNFNKEIYVKTDDFTYLYKEVARFGFDEDKMKLLKEAKENITYDTKIRQCNMMGEMEYESSYIYVDKYQNIVCNEDEFSFFHNIGERREEFINMYLDTVVKNAYRIRIDWKQKGKYDFLSNEQIAKNKLF